MRAAPPVEAALDGGRVERMLIRLLHAAVGALLVVWLALHAGQQPGWHMLLAALLAAAAMSVLGHWLARRALPVAPGHLRWDGQTWCTVDGDQAVPLHRLVVALDLGFWMLLQLHPADGARPQWRVASAAAAHGSWHGLRVAMAAHAGAPLRATP